jgi:hypothetical protein
MPSAPEQEYLEWHIERCCSRQSVRPCEIGWNVTIEQTPIRNSGPTYSTLAATWKIGRASAAEKIANDLHGHPKHRGQPQLQPRLPDQPRAFARCLDLRRSHFESCHELRTPIHPEPQAPTNRAPVSINDLPPSKRPLKGFLKR